MPYELVIPTYQRWMPVCQMSKKTLGEAYAGIRTSSPVLFIYYYIYLLLCFCFFFLLLLYFFIGRCRDAILDGEVFWESEVSL